MKIRIPLAAVLLLILSAGLAAQSPTLLDFNQATIDHQRTAMYALGGWALVNIGGGLALQGSATGSTKDFHRMNALWNTVNLAIAGVGYFSLAGTSAADWDLTTGLAKHHNFQKILLFNAGLDVGYVMGGLYLRERARRPGADADQLTGFGNAIVLQGAFLFAFDLVNYFIASGRAADLPLRLGATADGLGMTLTF